MIVAADDPLFSMPLGQNEEEWTAWLGREAVWERYRTLGQVAVLEGGELEVRSFLILLSFHTGCFANRFRGAENSQRL